MCSASMDKLERIIIPAAVDSTQQEALSILKKLKVCLLKHNVWVCVRMGDWNFRKTLHKFSNELYQPYLSHYTFCFLLFISINALISLK